MEQIIECRIGYKEFKQRLDNAFNKATESFVEIGYYLRIAHDNPEIIKESGYVNIYDLAKAEYGGIDKSTVSRFININERFSEGGFSDKLAEQYRGYGRSKLSAMLLLPDSINEEITTSFTRDEIEDIVAEYKEERTITDLEVLMEGQDEEQMTMDNNLYKVLHQLGKDEPEWYVKLFETVDTGVVAVQEVLAPDHEKIYCVRIMGVGKLMMSVKSVDRPVTLTNMRSGEKEEYCWEDVMEALRSLMVQGITPEKSWECKYDAEFPKKVEVAPVQPTPAKKETPKKEPPKKESKVKKAAPPKKKEPEKVAEPEEQIPGQDNIINHPEYLPEEMQKSPEILNTEPSQDENTAAVVEETLENVTEQAEIVEKTPLEDAETPENPKSEEEINAIWNRAAAHAEDLNYFFEIWDTDRRKDKEVTIEMLRNTYNNAISVAADLERLLNSGKYKGARHV